ncbi:hypothetical protein ACIQAL_26940 [Pseudomonas sp. NPDC088368]|jgi:hypothetical protein|uniref:hypothetical protein n=1 Tax=Pseudomonas sp. NPDC088368 TaxID=3364453 RepID=UPI0038193B33
MPENDGSTPECADTRQTRQACAFPVASQLVDGQAESYRDEMGVLPIDDTALASTIVPELNPD